MKRRTFVLTTTAVTLGVISISVAGYLKKYSKSYDPLIMPDDLGRFCDENAIRAIGDQYRKLMPGEDNKLKLKEILLTNENGKIIPGSDKLEVLELLDKKILKDFSEYKTLIITGWVISVTEARQCALFSLA